MRTYTPKADDIEHHWWLVDASGKTLGRLATEIARVLRGKHKPMYTPHLDTGDNVVVINAEKVRLTGNKADQKTYFKHTGYMGNEQHIPYRRMIENHPERVIELAVKGMLPKERSRACPSWQAEGLRGHGASSSGPAAPASGHLGSTTNGR